MNGMAWKFSVTYKLCKPRTGSISAYKRVQKSYSDFDTILEGVPYPFIGGACSSSTHARDFPNQPNDIFMGGLGGSLTFRGHDSTFGSEQRCSSAFLQRSNLPEEEMEGGHDSGSSRASSSKSLTTQIKDIALKVSNSLQIKACTGSSHKTEGDQEYPYVANVSAPQTPGWDFGGFHQSGGIVEQELMGGSTSNQTPRDDEVEFTGFQTTTDESSISMGGFTGFHTTRHEF